MPKRTPRRAAAPAFSNTVPAPAAATGSALSNVSQASAQAFTFGDPVPVLDGREILDYCEAWLNGKWYEPPISWEGLARSFRAATHHASALYFKRNVLASTFVPHRLLSRDTFGKFALDFLTFGNAYLERTPNILGRDLGLRHSLAMYMRRGQALDTYYFVQGFWKEHEFKPGSVFHLIEPDINQEVYGLPEYLSTLQAAWLNESATLAEALLLLSAAALPAPSASARPMLSRLLPRVELLSPAPVSFWSWARIWPEAPSAIRTAAAMML